MPHRIGIGPVFDTRILFPDIEALAGEGLHPIRRTGDGQYAVIAACAVGLDRGGVEVIKIRQTADAGIKDLQFKCLTARGSAAAQRDRLGKGDLIIAFVAGIGVGKRGLTEVDVVARHMDLQLQLLGSHVIPEGQGIFRFRIVPSCCACIFFIEQKRLGVPADLIASCRRNATPVTRGKVLQQDIKLDCSRECTLSASFDLQII